MEKKEKKKTSAKELLPAAISIGIGVAAGIFISTNIDFEASASLPFGEYMLNVVLILLLFYVTFFIQLIVHEAGHLIFGLATGYRFVSFRIANWMIVKTKEGMKYRRMALAGTGGQCLLSPPEMKEGKYPYVLYNLGGVLLNGIFSLLFVPLLFVCEGYGHTFASMMIVCGVFIILTNGIPLKTKDIANDGYNALHMGDDLNSMKAMHQQLQINALQMEGLRLKEMPEELFEVKEDADLHNPLISSINVFKENRLMDQLKFDEALALIDDCLSNKMTVLGIYQSLLKMDRYTIELLKDAENADDTVLSDKSVKQIMTAMKENPTVIRVQIADATLKKKDKAEKEKLLAYFDKVTPHYPSQGDIAAERDILKLISEKENA